MEKTTSISLPQGGEVETIPDYTLDTFLEFITSINTECDKAEVTRKTLTAFSLRRSRSIYYCPSFAVRFSYTAREYFSNSVLSLSALSRFDDRTVVVVIVGREGVRSMLINSSALLRISHSSHNLTVDNIKGSFLGGDIAKVIGGLENKTENILAIYESVRNLSFTDNLPRIVDAS